jgi:hypothetical protein
MSADDLSEAVDIIQRLSRDRRVQDVSLSFDGYHWYSFAVVQELSTPRNGYYVSVPMPKPYVTRTAINAARFADEWVETREWGPEELALAARGALMVSIDEMVAQCKIRAARREAKRRSAKVAAAQSPTSVNTKSEH